MRWMKTRRMSSARLDFVQKVVHSDFHVGLPGAIVGLHLELSATALVVVSAAVRGFRRRRNGWRTGLSGGPCVSTTRHLGGGGGRCRWMFSRGFGVNIMVLVRLNAWLMVFTPFLCLPFTFDLCFLNPIMLDFSRCVCFVNTYKIHCKS